MDEQETLTSDGLGSLSGVLKGGMYSSRWQWRVIERRLVAHWRLDHGAGQHASYCDTQSVPSAVDRFHISIVITSLTLIGTFPLPLDIYSQDITPSPSPRLRVFKGKTTC